MKIVRLEVRPLELTLSEPYEIAYETVSTVANVMVEIVTDRGLVGRGCAAPDLPVTGEGLEDTLDVLTRVVEPIVQGADPLRRSLVLEELGPHLNQRPSALASIDMALHDLLGQVAGVPLWKLLGGSTHRLETSVTIGILPVVETVERAQTFRRQGFRCLKIKGGHAVELDIERVHRVREALGPEVEIRFDANQGYSKEQALHFVSQTAPCDVSILEQPTPRDDFDTLGSVTRRSEIPVMADESLLGLRDAFRIAAGELADMINIKLMKVGGIDQGLHVNSVARAAGVDVMVGCMDECALSIAASLHFALARPNIRYADLDGHLDLLDDPTQGAVILRDGFLYPTEYPGLGWRSP